MNKNRRIFSSMEDVKQAGLIDEIQKARKTAMTQVILMKEEFICNTPEGIVEGKVGDYLAIGIKGEVYPIGREYFEATYIVEKENKE